MLFGIYDLEIIKAIPPKNDADRIKGIEYCAGWDDFSSMGISVAAFCILDSEDWSISEAQGYFNVDEMLQEIMDLEFDFDLKLGGFNSSKFDDLLLQANGFPVISDFDILQLILEEAGDKEKQYWQEGRSYSLKAIAEANGYKKTLSGELAPIYWQQGKRQEVLDYCCNDVLIEAETMKRLMTGTLVDPNQPRTLYCPAIDFP